MNTLHFKYAVEIEKTRSITQAAENLYMAQPNMSKAIKELENTLGITIFRRTSKGVIPTEQGMKFLEYAKQILIQIDNMEAINAPDTQQIQKMKISSIRSEYIFTAFSEFAAEFDDSNNIETYFEETGSMKTISNIREQRFDFGIIRFNTQYEKYFMDYLAEKNLSSQILWEFEMIALMHPSNPVSELENIQYSDLCSSCTEILYGDNEIPYILIPSGSDRSKISRKIYVFDRGSQTQLLSSVKNSFTLDSPSPEEIIRKKGLIQKKCNFPNNLYRDILIYTSGHKMTNAEIQFVNKIFEVRNRAAFGSFS